MSLVSLTFGDGKSNFSLHPHIQVTRPSDCIKAEPGVENKVEVIKSCIFFKHSEPYVVGNVVSGIVSDKMTGIVNGKRFKITELESKYGNAGIAKKGMTVGLSIQGLENELLEKGTVIVFE